IYRVPGLLAQDLQCFPIGTPVDGGYFGRWSRSSVFKLRPLRKLFNAAMANIAVPLLVILTKIWPSTRRSHGLVEVRLVDCLGRHPRHPRTRTWNSTFSRFFAHL